MNFIIKTIIRLQHITRTSITNSFRIIKLVNEIQNKKPQLILLQAKRIYDTEIN